MEADIGLIGLAVMGQNLVLNMNDHGYRVAVYNRTASKVDAFFAGPAQGTKIIGSNNLKDFLSRLTRPRKVMFMVKAGKAVDELIEECLPYLDKGDILIDGGNSHYLDTERREQVLHQKGILFIGMGISGGEEGARFGPSIMPGGSSEAWFHVKSIFQSIAAKAEDGASCCEWVGERGAGHYVKMIHNGIEYGDMQLICEVYHILRDFLKLDSEELQQIFLNWNQGELKSYLIEITAHILGYRDHDDQLVIDKILDVAGQKGTGAWTATNALEQGVPVTLIAESVFARFLSALKEERIEASQIYQKHHFPHPIDKKLFIEELKQALYAAKIVSYTQGFLLLKAAADSMKWNLDYGKIALLWRGGCIIRSHFLADIQKAFLEKPSLPSLLLDPFFSQEIQRSLKGWRSVVSQAIQAAIPVPCLASGLTFLDGYTTAYLPANLLQAQRDFFGAHTYEKIDCPRGQWFHTDWLQKNRVYLSSTQLQ